MRNLFSTTAILAALAFSGAASAQNISVQSNQINTGTVNADLRIDHVTMAGGGPRGPVDVIVGSALAVGNVLQTNAPNGQGVSEAASNNGGTLSPQNNSGAITSDVSFSTTLTPNSVSLSSGAVGNLATLDGVSVVNSGNRVLGQVNSGNVVSTLTLQGGGYNTGDLKASSLAIGNNLSADGSSTVQLGAGQNGGGILTQTNTGGQTATTNFVFGGDSRNLTASATAVGNVLSADAPTVGVTMTQNNAGPGQVANLTINQGAQQIVGSSTAMGNLVAPTGGSFSSAGGLVQVNSAQQTANTSFQGVSVFNGGTANGSATAVGNAIQIAQIGPISLSGSQSNTGAVTANLDATGGYTGAATFSSQGFGNLVAATTDGSFGSGMPQTNSGAIMASASIDGNTFGETSLSSLAIGNALQVRAGVSEGINGAANQTNSGPVMSSTTVSLGSFTGLNASSTAIGNLTTVSTGSTGL